MPLIVEVLILKGAFSSGVAVTFDVFATANRVRVRSGHPPPFALRAVGSGARQARAFIGGENADGPADILLVPGLGMSSPSEITERLAANDACVARRMLVAAIEKNVTIAAGLLISAEK